MKLNSVDEQYRNLLIDISENGHLNQQERTGTGTKSVFGRQLRFKMSEGLPVLTTKKMFFKGIITELLWFLGNHIKDDKYSSFPLDNIKYLLDNDVNIWVGDCYKAYLKYVNDPSIEDEVIEWCIDDPAEAKLRVATEKEFIGFIKTNNHFALKFGGIGAGYGWQWRHFGGDYDEYKKWFVPRWKDKITSGYINDEIDKYGSDQIKNLIDKLKTNPKDRRLIVTAWNPTDLDKTTLPPCHYGFSCYVRELSTEERNKLSEKFGLDRFEENSKYNNIKTWEEYNKFLDECKIPKYALSLMERQRSVDTPLGLPFNITSYGILLELIAREVNMVPDELIMSLENTHIYLNQLEGVQEHISRVEGFALPKLKINSHKSLFDLNYEDFEIVGYKSLGRIQFPLSN